MIKGLEMLPEYMRGGMERYLKHGIEPGSFLTAVLENNLTEAIGRADETNINRLRDYAVFLYSYAPKYPTPSWGSREAVEHWIKSGGALGLGLKLRETD